MLETDSGVTRFPLDSRQDFLAPSVSPGQAGASSQSTVRKFMPRVLLLGFFLAVVGGFFLSGAHHYFDWETVHGQVASWKETALHYPVAVMGSFFLIYFAATAFSLPSAAMLTLISGALFGRVWGTILASVASTLGATAAMLMSRFVLGEWVQARFGKRITPLQEGMKENGGYFLFTLRLIPLFPFFLVNLGMGLTGISVRAFVLASWLGMLPGTFLYVNAGTEISSLKSPREILSPGVLGAFALLGLVPLALKYFLMPKRKPEPVSVTDSAEKAP